MSLKKYTSKFEETMEVIEFDIFIGDSLEFRTRADDSADQVDRKLKQKKFKNADNLKIMRSSNDGYEDVTSIFL
jgi:hypothetical protein